MRHHPARLLVPSYRFTTMIEPRFGDVDALRHLNNVALAGIYEEARIRFTNTFDHGPMGREGQRPVIAEVRIRYLAEGQYPGTLTAGVGVLHIGRSSYSFGQGLFQDGRCIGTADTVLVFTSGGRPFPIPDHFRDALTSALLPIEASAPA